MIMSCAPISIQVTVAPKPVSYPIAIGSGIAYSAELVSLLKEIDPSHVFVCKDQALGDYFSDFLRQQGFCVQTIPLPAGDACKTRKTKEWIEDQMLASGASREALMIGIGGGSVLDVAGFVASTYARGIPLLAIPTTLLAMSDAVIGGKTAVNTAEGKNLIGSIYQPRAVFIDCDFLKTLSLAEMKNGFVEMIKHGLIQNESYFDFLYNNADKLLSGDFIEEAIAQSVRIKSHVVMEDERESGKRRILNLGHTVGHALETVSNHQISHGKAVALGLITEAYLSMQMGYLPPSEFTSLRQILERFQMDLSLPSGICPDSLYNAMCMDKKSRKARPRIVILERIGSVAPFDGHYCTEVPDNLLKESVNWLLEPGHAQGHERLRFSCAYFNAQV